MKFKTFRALVVGGGVVVVAGGIALCVARTKTQQAAVPVAQRPTATTTAATTTGSTTAAASFASASGMPASGPPSASGSAGSSASAPLASREELRPLDRDILARIAQPLASGHLKDAFAGRPYKVDLYQDEGHAHVNRVKLDLNRNGKWDEKWTVDAEATPRTVKRDVSPADDETYTQEWRLDGDAWRAKTR